MMRWRLRDVFDARSGLAGAMLLGGIVFTINAGHGAGPAAVAAAKQFAYTFAMGGVVMRLCTDLALSARRGSALLAVLVPSAFTIGATLVLHGLRGTPEPLLSVLPAALLAPPSFAAWSWRVRRDGRSPWQR